MNTTGKGAALLANASLAMALLLGAGQAASAEYWLCAKTGSVTMPGGAPPVPIWGYVQDDATNNLADGCPGAPALPGPALTVPAGDTTLIVHLRNELPEPTSIVIPGQIAATMVPVWDNDLTGGRTSPTQRVRSFTHEAATSNGVATYTWNSVKPGSYLYHSGSHPQVQVQMGLYGAVIKNAVDAVPATSPAEAYAGVAYDAQQTLLFSEIDPAQHAAIANGSFGGASAPNTPCPNSASATMPMTSTLCYKPKYFLINGTAFQSGAAALATLPVGQRTLLRFINAGLQSYVPMLQGMHMRMVAEDGNRYVYRDNTGSHPRDQYQYSTLLPALKTTDAVITPTRAGRYPLYDRRLNLVNNTVHNGGMFAFFDAVGADLSITKTDGVTSVEQGGALIYTIAVTNHGQQTVTDARVADTMPAALSSFAWSCSATAGSTCATASGTGSINHLVTLAASGVATFTVNATVAATATPGPGALVNTATVTPPAGVADAPGNNSATDTDEITAAEQPPVNLGITKTNGVNGVAPGQAVTYTIVATNIAGPPVTGATVTDTFPAQLTGVTWNCTAAGTGSSCGGANPGAGNISRLLDLASGGSVTFVVNATVAANATGSVVNTATVAAPAGVTDPVPANNSATDTDAITQQANLGITNTNGVTGVVADRPVTYTIAVNNAGPSAVTAARVTDTMPAALIGVTWTCAASAGSACAVANGTSNINTTVNLPLNGTATFTVSGRVAPTATGNLVNTATVATPTGVSDPTPANNSATDTDAISQATANLGITKTDGVASVAPGAQVTYTIVASNAGPIAVTGATVTDTLPAALTAVSWSCVASAGSSCGLPATGNVGNFSRAVNLLVGGTATFTVNATVSATATGSVANTATVATPAGVTDPTPANNSATDTDTITTAPIQANLGITKTDNVASVAPGAQVTYSIVASNAGPAAVTGATVTDTLPPALTAVSWSCVASAGSSCGLPATGNVGNFSRAVNLLSGGSATFTVNATVAATATGSVANTATVTAPAGVTDPTPANNSATDTDTVTPPAAGTANLAITQTDGLTSVFAGEAVAYTIVASNAGPSAVTGASVTDTLPATLTGVSWSCVASAGSSCGLPATGNVGSISRAVNLLSGGSATFTVNATVAATATGSVANTASVATPAGVTDPTPANNSATDTDTIAAIPVPTTRDNFTRATAANLGANWSQATTAGGVIDLGVFDVTAGNTATGIAIANQVNDGGRAMWNVPAAGFGATQAAGYTYASGITLRNNSALILKATGGTAAAPQNFVRVLYQQFNPAPPAPAASGQVLVQTTTNGNAATPTWTTHGTLNNTNSGIAQGNRLNAQVDNSGRVRVWKTVGTTSMYIGKVQLPATDPLWTTGGGRIGVKFETIGTRIDDFRGN